MCGNNSYEEESLDFDKELLSLFRQYERNTKCEFSEKDMMEITQDALINDFLITIKDRLYEVLEKDKCGEDGD